MPSSDRFKPALKLQAATEADAMIAFPWRNDPSSRSQFHDSTPIDAEAHRAWWTATLSNPDRSLLMAMRDGVPVGVVRLDRTGASAEVSIYLDPAQAGRGFGRQALTAAVDHARLIGLTSLVASIKESNTRSQRAFAATGFDKRG
uniref:GNAT family N-acetyltransferase n=1 Tax=Phenylobacterium sp. TaxID=1871053 RepID=UPI0028114D28